MTPARSTVVLAPATIRAGAWAGAAGFGVGLPFCFALAFAGSAATARPLAALCGAALVAAAPFACGALLGFIFGIPRTQPAQPSTPSPAPTNLEQISDWLTKILVGAGLTQLHDVPAVLVRAARHGGQTFDAGESGTNAALMMIVYFLAAGFFAGYLVTRIVLRPVLDDAERRVDPSVVRRLNATPLDETVSAPTRDKNAILSFEMEQLDSAPELTAWARAKLDEADFEAAASGFERAAALRDGTEEDQRRAAEGLMFASLYEPPPSGFRGAINAAEAYLARKDARPSAALLAWYGCALGQAYAFAQRNGRSDELASLRRRALEALRRALDIDPGWRRTLARALRATGVDDDLASFQGDPDFEALLGPDSTDSMENPP